MSDYSPVLIATKKNWDASKVEITMQYWDTGGSPKDLVMIAAPVLESCVLSLQFGWQASEGSELMCGAAVMTPLCIKETFEAEACDIVEVQLDGQVVRAPVAFSASLAPKFGGPA